LKITLPSCRYVDPSQPLHRYNWLHSYCHLLHQHMAKGTFAQERFEGCGAIASNGKGYVFVTEANVVVAVPQQANETYEAKVSR